MEGRAKPIQAMDLPICGRFVDQGGSMASMAIWPFGGPGNRWKSSKISQDGFFAKGPKCVE